MYPETNRKSPRSLYNFTFVVYLGDRKFIPFRDETDRDIQASIRLEDGMDESSSMTLDLKIVCQYFYDAALKPELPASTTDSEQLDKIRRGIAKICKEASMEDEISVGEGETFEIIDESFDQKTDDKIAEEETEVSDQEIEETEPINEDDEQTVAVDEHAEVKTLAFQNYEKYLNIHFRQYDNSTDEAVLRKVASQMSDIVSITNFYTLLQVSDHIGLKLPKEFIVKNYLGKKNFGIIKETNEWKELKKNQPLYVEITEMLLSNVMKNTTIVI